MAPVALRDRSNDSRKRAAGAARPGGAGTPAKAKRGAGGSGTASPGGGLAGASAGGGRGGKGPAAAPAQAQPATTWADIAEALSMEPAAPWQEVAQELIRVRMAGKGRYDYKGQIEMMRPYIKQLRAALHHSMDACAFAEAEAGHKLREKEEEVSAALAEVEKLEAEAEAAKRAAVDAEGSAAEEAAAKEAALEEVRAAEGQVAEAQASLVIRAAELEDLHQELAVREADLKDALSRVKELQRTISKLQEEATASDAKSLSLQDALADLRGENAELKGVNGGLQMQVDSQREATRLAEEARAQALSEAAAFREEAQADRVRVEQRHDREAQAAADVMRRVESEKLQLAETIATMKGTAATLEVRLEGLEGNLSDAEQSKRILAQDFQALKLEAASLEGRLADTIQRHEEQVAASLRAFGEEKAALKAAAEHSLAEAKEAAAALTSAQKALAESEVAKKEAQAQHAEAHVQVFKLAEETTSQKARIEELEALQLSTEVRLTEALEELQLYEKATSSTAGEMEELARKSTALEDQNASHKEILTAMQTQFQLAQTKLNMVEQAKLSQLDEIEAMQKKMKSMEAALAAAEQKCLEGELVRRKMHNTIQELKGNIRVFCRLRPANQEEVKLDRGLPELYERVQAGEQAGKGICLSLPAEASKTGGKKQEASKYTFAFDRTFGEAAQQEDIFEEVSQLVQSSLDGYKVCIFAYGQTGSGKTHTMMGDANAPGLIPRSLEQIFSRTQALREEQGWDFVLKASMLEIYNENYRDLLGSKLPEGKQHTVKHDAKGNTEVSFLTEAEVRTRGEAQALIQGALENRSVAATQMNSQSSRSHSVFMLKVDGVNRHTQERQRGVLNLIDLAGSERLSRSGATGDRLKETQSINKSLSALGDVISAIAMRENHIPYRNSKLTWLLQPCLGGEAKTLMFVNIAPTHSSAQESLCSLRFAAKVNACEVGTARRTIVKK